MQAFSGDRRLSDKHDGGGGLEYGAGGPRYRLDAS
jgi:hypothetical protein